MNGTKKVDPYGGFKCDDQRRRALGTRERWRALAFVSVAVVLVLSGASASLLALVRHAAAALV